MNDISKDLHAVIDDAELLLQHVKREAGSEMGEARQRLEASLHAAKARLQGVQQALGENVQHTVRATEGYVQDKPWTALGISAGLGLLVGLVIGARK
jgi:ElaB/YqjD/DUF883 family membrane-anchored ribosome-binding protein